MMSYLGVVSLLLPLLPPSSGYRTPNSWLSYLYLFSLLLSSLSLHYFRFPFLYLLHALIQHTASFFIISFLHSSPSFFFFLSNVRASFLLFSSFFSFSFEAEVEA